MASGLFGWNLLYNSVSKDIKSNEDVLVCLTHLILISEGFQCIGIGDSKNIDGNETKTETLPTGWNDNYRLRYVHQGRLYNFQGTIMDDGIMINLLRPDERTVSMVQLNSRLVLRRNGNLDEMIPSNKDVIKKVKEQLIEKVIRSTKTKESGSQTAEANRSTTNLQFPPEVLPPYLQRDPLSVHPPGVGRNDLDPLGGLTGPGFGGFPGFPAGGGRNPLGTGGGGMLFQPPGRFDQPRYGGIPGGSIPPGARFDPFRPPDVDRYRPPRRPPPDNDEFPPPGFDDMYM